jgi:hypothetical protein
MQGKLPVAGSARTVTEECDSLAGSVSFDLEQERTSNMATMLEYGPWSATYCSLLTDSSSCHKHTYFRRQPSLSNHQNGLIQVDMKKPTHHNTSQNEFMQLPRKYWFSHHTRNASIGY